jgi:hypothetical protein
MVWPGYSTGYRVATAPWETCVCCSHPVHIYNPGDERNRAGYGSHALLCSHPVATRKPAEIRHFQPYWLLTTSFSPTKEEREKKGRPKEYARERSHRSRVEV